MRFWILSFWLLASSVITKAIERVEGTWEVLDGCRLVSAPFNDGDSFLISHRGETYTFRLFNVDALETSESYIDRISDQACSQLVMKSSTLMIRSQTATL